MQMMKMDKVELEEQNMVHPERDNEKMNLSSSNEKKTGSSDPHSTSGSHSAHGGCGMHGGWMRWIWIGILGYFLVSYFLK